MIDNVESFVSPSFTLVITKRGRKSMIRIRVYKTIYQQLNKRTTSD